MKLITIASLAIPSIYGNIDNVGQFLKELAEAAEIDPETLTANWMGQPKNVTEEDVEGLDASGRTLASGWANSMVNSIDGYACWCYFENDHGKGRGPVQNDLDAQCKVLHDGYSCILMDSEDEGDACIPWEEEYNAPSGVIWWSKTGDDESMKEALRKDCWKKNKKKGDCAQRACIVEGYFSINLFKLLTSGKKYDPKLKHDLNKWDAKSECQIKVNHSDAEKKCCGEYPIRFPYKHLTGRRECCNGHTYNAEFLQCCGGDEVKLTCF